MQGFYEKYARQRERGRFLLKPKGLGLAKAKLRYNFAEKQKHP